MSAQATGPPATRPASTIEWSTACAHRNPDSTRWVSYEAGSSSGVDNAPTAILTPLDSTRRYGSQSVRLEDGDGEGGIVAHPGLAEVGPGRCCGANMDLHRQYLIGDERLVRDECGLHNGRR